ncbi:MAG: 4-hydroxyphenylpyruvate dioxygenase [Actinophytocola sp.]|uniref:4-hydroxyphenylpyruvate dioxygenase n=1 Tax=Actinophytocola sp. TaxID=1872138 RepID=UPI003C70C36D
MKETRKPLPDTWLDHVRCYVGDLDAAGDRLAGGYGLAVYARSADEHQRSVALGRDAIRVVLTAARTDDHPAAVYVTQHGDGVADIALGTTDAAAAFTEAVRRGARPVHAPARAEGVVTASVLGFGDVVHTFVQRDAGLPVRHLPGLRATGGAPDPDTGLLEIDHFAVCLEAAQLDATVAFYEEVLDFRMTFEEKIVVGTQAMNSKVVRNPSGTVTLTLIEPDTTADPGQIDEFVKNHAGAGVQHVAFRTADIAGSVRTMSRGGVEFLTTPPAYYRLLAERLTPLHHSVAELGELSVLADEDHGGQLYQIFTRTTHPRGTLFFEVIERVGATLFGSGNIRALYQAVEAERSR